MTGSFAPGVEPFELHHHRYDRWFDENEVAYLSELLTVRLFVPLRGRALEIGVGSGRFAAPLGISVGLDPSPAMLAHAARRGVETCQGVAEQLPFSGDSFDCALLVTTLCFLQSPAKALSEIRRVLKPGGRLVIGFIDRLSPIGRQYEARRNESMFYRAATFYSAGEVERLLVDAGYAVRRWAQTLTQPPGEIREIEPASAGRGRGAFVVVAARNRK